MKRVTKTLVRTRKANRLVLPRLLMFVTLIAFSLQTYLTQTHIHMASEGRAIAALDHASGKAVPGTPAEPADKYPPGEDPANCPLCQEILHAGQFITPAAVPLLVPSAPIFTVEIATPVAHLVPSVTHIWRGRAPPRN